MENGIAALLSHEAVRMVRKFPAGDIDGPLAAGDRFNLAVELMNGRKNSVRLPASGLDEACAALLCWVKSA